MILKRIGFLFNLKDPMMRYVVRRYLSATFHRYTVLDFCLNLIAPLKVKASPEAIKGISRWKLHWAYRGVLRVDPGNVLQFQEVSYAPRGDRFRCHCEVRVSGSNNMMVVRGRLKSLPARLLIAGEHNTVEIGSDFFCQAEYLKWCVSGHDNVLKTGDSVTFSTDNMVDSHCQLIDLDGENCSIDLADKVRIKLKYVGNAGMAKDFHLSVGEGSQIGSMRVSATSSCRFTIGKGFYCSWDCYFWCSGHSVLAKDGTLLNDCREITIGDHVWFGHGIEVPGEIKIADGCIIGNNVVLTNNVLKPNSIVTVAPAKIYPVNVRWVKESPVMLQRGVTYKDLYGRE